MLNPLDLSTKTILITGASSGIGRETAILLSNLGARIILVSRNIEKLHQTKNMMRDNNHVIYPMDFEKPQDMTEQFKELVNQTGMLDGMVHCAGIQVIKSLQFSTLEIIEKIFNINLISTISLSRAFRQPGIAKNPSSIVLLSSVAALFGNPGLALYSATKGALISLTKSLAIELSKKGIRINCIVPGMVDTDMLQKVFNNMSEEQRKQWDEAHLLGIGKPLDIAYMIGFLVSAASEWITGSIFTVDGGFSAFKVK